MCVVETHRLGQTGGDRGRKRVGWRCRAAADAPNSLCKPLHTFSLLDNKSTQMVTSEGMWAPGIMWLDPDQGNAMDETTMAQYNLHCAELKPLCKELKHV